MHNWLELYLFGRDKVAEAARSAAEFRRGRTGAGARAAKRPTNLILARGEVLTIRVKRGSLRVTCRTGRVWATSDRTRMDSLLLPTDSVTYRGRGTIVIEALRTATLRLQCEEVARVALGVPLRPALVLG